MAFVLPAIGAIGSALAGSGAALGSMFGAAGAGAAASAAGSSLAMGAASTVLGTASGVLGGIQAYQQGMFQSKLATYNEQLALGNKNASLEAGENAGEMERLKTGKLVGSEAAATAAGGTDVAGGSAEQVRDATRAAGEMDAQTLRYNAAREAYGYSQEAFSDQLQAQSAKQSAISGLVGGIFKAGSSFLSGASSLGDKWSQFQMSGALQVPTTEPIDTVLNSQG